MDSAMMQALEQFLEAGGEPLDPIEYAEETVCTRGSKTLVTTTTHYLPREGDDHGPWVTITQRRFIE